MIAARAAGRRTASARICMLANQDHATHPIIRRQLKTLSTAGYRVAVVDQGEISAPSTGHDGAVVRVRPVSLQWFGRWVWRALRRVDEQRLGEPWWTVVYFLQVLLTGFRYGRAAVGQKADLYQAHDLETLLPALIAGKLRRRTVVYDAHELTSEQGDPRSLRKGVERWLERQLVPLADYVVTPNAPRARIYARRHRLQNAPVVVRNCPPSVEVARTDVLRQTLGLSSQTRIVVYHGALIEGRALDNLVASARAYDDDIALVMIGQQTRYSETVLECLAGSGDPGRRVHFIPFIEPDLVLDYVASADLGVVIYQNINLNNYLCAPTKLYEYLMVRLPVVVSAFPEMLDLLGQFPVGRAFDPDDASSIAAAVNAFFRTRDEHRDELDAALAQARRHFTWEHESRNLLEIYDRVPRQ